MVYNESVVRAVTTSAVDPPGAGRVIESSAARREEVEERTLPEAWRISEASYPADGGMADRLRFLLGYAVLAPSSRNAQPWRFRIEGDIVRLYADRARALPVSDPDNRQTLIGCGAALLHLRLALRRFGHADRVRMFPDPAERDLLAEVSAGDGAAATAEDVAFFEEIRRRRTQRGSFERREVSGSTVQALRVAAAREGVWLLPVESRAVRAAVASLVAAGHRTQQADEHFRHEMAAWLRPNDDGALDGLPGYVLGLGDVTARLAPSVVRHVNLARFQADRQRELARSAPLLAVLGTAADEPEDWLTAGQALGRVLLTASAAGLAVGYLSQPLEIPGLRRRLREVLGTEGHPQLLLRAGYAPPPRPTPRRPVSEVLA